MIPWRWFNQLFVASVFFTALMPWSTVAATSDTADFYTAYSNGQDKTVVNNSLRQALESNKPLLLILGANWCHDSRALASYFDDTHVQQASQAFEVLPLNVGYLEDKSSVLTQFGYPAYFATPTVLVIDPASKTVLNRDSLVIWQSAHNESATALTDYLSGMASTWKAYSGSNETTGQLRDFELNQATTLYSHYQHLGELLRKKDEGQNTPTLNPKWNEVKAFRVQLQQDLIRFHHNNEIVMPLPEYPAILWE
ncbi:thioredoxin family protein [Alteromonas sp. AMM-1]|uniref:thioredoxin family protein n=1 Tax=Alteromonas sp. AMM-1 TaxID=3394233 RepID=UPI0039A6CFEB